MRKSCMTIWSVWILAIFVGLPPLPSTAATDENAVEPADKKEKPAEIEITHAGIGAKVEVSSTHTGEPGEGPPSFLVDGDLTTRWSSDYSAPQEVKVDLGKIVKLARLRLHWERASALRYSVVASMDGKKWVNVHLLYMKTRGEPEPRVDNVKLKDLEARYIRLDLLGCVNEEWGFSLYEIEIAEAEDEKQNEQNDTEEVGKEQQ